jgi:acyl dehydratase
MKTFYFEDLEIDQMWESPDYPVTRNEIIAFASRWSPQPYHINDEAAGQSIFGSLVACESHIFAIKSSLGDKLEDRVFMLAGLGFGILNSSIRYIPVTGCASNAGS